MPNRIAGSIVSPSEILGDLLKKFEKAVEVLFPSVDLKLEAEHVERSQEVFGFCEDFRTIMQMLSLCPVDKEREILSSHSKANSLLLIITTVQQVGRRMHGNLAEFRAEGSDLFVDKERWLEFCDTVLQNRIEAMEGNLLTLGRKLAA